MATQPLSEQLRFPKAPRLPTAPVEYDHRFMEQFESMLRLYFNQLDNANSSVYGPRGQAYLSAPHGSFTSRVTQSVSVINTPTRVSFDTVDYASGMYFVPGDGIHVQNSGVYNVQFSVQVTNTDTQAHDMVLWLRSGTGAVAAVDVPYTSSVITVAGTHGGQPGYGVLAANFYIDLLAGQYIELWWAANSTQVQLNTLPPITTPFVNPGSPSVIATLSFVSALPA